MPDYTDTKTSLVINKLTNARLNDLKTRGLVEPHQIYLTTDDPEIPSIAGEAGKFLSNNGTEYIWDTVGDGTLTIQKNGTTIGTFSANQSTNKTINIEADTQVQADWTETDSTQPDYILHKPTNVSDFTNDANYQNASQVGASITTAIGEHNTANDAHSNILTPIKADITDIQALIPNAATTSNQLADKDFVNSTVSTQTANFIGTFANVSELRAYSGTITNNDYAFVINQVVTDNGNDWATFAALDAYDKNLLTDYDYAWVIDGTKFDLYRFDIVEQEWSLKADNIDKDDVSLNRAFCRYKATVSGSTVTWNYEYTLNNSSFTAAQWAAINSGVSQSMVDNYLSPTSSSINAYVNRISALEGNKVDKTSTANRLYGTDSTGAQTTWQAGDNIELSADGKINVTGVQQQMFEMPEATADLLGSIVQYLGDTDEDYTHGVMYQCVPVYGSFTVTAVGINNVTLDEEAFMNSNLYDASITSYTFECTRAGLRQTWLLPNGRSHSGTLYIYGISYSGRPTLGATITLSRSVIGYAWEPYAGVLAGNDKIKIVGEKISGVNVVGQYNATTMPMASAELAGTIVQYNGEQTLLSMYRNGHFYRCEEDRYMRNYTLEADPMKYSTLMVDNWIALQDFMMMYENPVTFVWQGDGRGWIEEESMSMLGTEDLTSYGITYTLESGQTLEVGDKITINFSSSYFWRMITVQDGVEVVQLWPEPSLEYTGKVLLYNGDLGAALPEPDALSVPGKLYTCVQTYNETTGDWEYEWQALPYQFGLLQYTELPSDPEKVYTDQCIQYVGLSQVWDKYAEDVYLENGHIYRATIVDEDDPDFAAVRYMDVHPYQMPVMPDPIAAYEGVITQYVGENGEYTNGHFYKCVPTGQMTGPSDKVKKDSTEWSVSVDPSVLETKTTDPTQTQVFEFRSQGEGYQWVLRVNDTTWTTVEIADYGITVTGTVPYGSELKVKYVEPQPEYIWEEIKTGNYLEQFSEPLDEDLYWTGKMIQYIGSDDGSWKEGHFYKFLTTVEPATSGDVSITITDEETLREVMNNIATNVAMYKLDFVAEGNFWVLRGFDISGNEIGNQAFTPDPTTFEQETGLLVSGTPQPNTPVEMNVIGYWEEVNISDNIQVKEIPEFTSGNVNRIVQYVGETSSDYTNGYFYKGYIRIEQTSGTATASVQDAKKFAETIEQVLTDTPVMGIRINAADNIVPVWELYYLDENGNEIAHTSTAANNTAFSEATGLWIEGTFETGSQIESTVDSGWERIDVQPGGGSGGNDIQVTEFPELKGEDIGKIVEYVGESSDDFVNGYFYKSFPTIYPTSDISLEVELSISQQDVFSNYINEIEANYSTTVYSVNATPGSSPWAINLAFMDKDGNEIFSQEYQDWELSDIVGLYVGGDMNISYNITAELVSYWKQHNVQERDQVNELPDPDEVPRGRIMQYSGETTENYTNGYFYQTVPDESESSRLNAEQEGPTLELQLSVEDFEAMQGMPTRDMVITLTYDGTDWHKDGEWTDLSYYGITILSGTPDATSVITLYYYAQPYMWKTKSVQPITYDGLTKSLIFD